MVRTYTYAYASVCVNFMYCLSLCFCIHKTISSIACCLQRSNKPNFYSSSSLICPFASCENKFPLGKEASSDLNIYCIHEVLRQNIVLYYCIVVYCTEQQNTLFLFITIMFCNHDLHWTVLITDEFKIANSLKYLNSSLFGPMSFLKIFTVLYHSSFFMSLFPPWHSVHYCTTAVDIYYSIFSCMFALRVDS